MVGSGGGWRFVAVAWVADQLVQVWLGGPGPERPKGACVLPVHPPRAFIHPLTPAERRWSGWTGNLG